ncbi:MAG: hypothetical protein ACE5J4_03225 [Candidatus Aenigmatarchaeota archaeon]
MIQYSPQYFFEAKTYVTLLLAMKDEEIYLDRREISRKANVDMGVMYILDDVFEKNKLVEKKPDKDEYRITKKGIEYLEMLNEKTSIYSEIYAENPEDDKLKSIDDKIGKILSGLIK